jgi:hypothetical protein
MSERTDIFDRLDLYIAIGFVLRRMHELALIPGRSNAERQRIEEEWRSLHNDLHDLKCRLPNVVPRQSGAVEKRTSYGGGIRPACS